MTMDTVFFQEDFSENREVLRLLSVIPSLPRVQGEIAKSAFEGLLINVENA